MTRIFKSRAKSQGLPPGTAVYVGQARAGGTQLEVISYDQASAEPRQEIDIPACLNHMGQNGVTWVNLTGLDDVAKVQTLCEGLGLHPLVLEDILNTDHRPKLEDYGEYLYAVLKMLRWDAAHNEVITEQVSFILAPGMVVSFQEIDGDVFDPIRQRREKNKGRVRKMGADYLFYCLIDALVDSYFTILEHISDRLEALESDLLERGDQNAMKKLHALKSEGLMLRKSIWPLREVVNSLEKCDSTLIDNSITIYLRDVHDHAIQAIDMLDTFRDMLAAMRDTYLSNISNRMNEIMKVLTIIATIFIPLTFIAGIYGMNFENMPELKWRWGYYASLGMMLAISAGMLIFFKRKKWL